MRRGARIALSTILVLGGLGFLAFFTLLLFVADCSQQCEANGERAPVFAFLGLGALLVVLGLRASAPRLRAVGEAMIVGGAVALAGAAWTFTQGARGAMAWVTLAVGAGALAVGAWLRLVRYR